MKTQRLITIALVGSGSRAWRQRYLVRGLDVLAAGEQGSSPQK